ncbi:MAG: hypothetical protein C0601_12135 [Candidatus Muiribacterium halophilum]|uniref:Type II secretion system protein GspG C-terminal domain-containing protein n=1 Tax=Muiribacterium halophilum TaxID=2053465 RepID=A0A2N5ZAL4_MUIH1|nr:MAG: hypothetical protein C0601_12135 [Candidatus Muirbacterium halophilum]
MFNLFRNKGFTLIELMAVTAIITLLAYSSIPFGETLYQNVREEKTINTLEKIRTALDAYYRDHGKYPIIPTFTETDSTTLRFTALQTLERELTGKEIVDFPDRDKIKSQRIYINEIPPNPYTGKKEDWEIRDSYLGTWRPINEAMNPATASSVGVYGTGGEGSTGVYSEVMTTTVTLGVAAPTVVTEINTAASNLGGYPVNIFQWKGGPVLGTASNATDVTNLLNAKGWPDGNYEVARTVNATSTYDNVSNVYKTRDIFDIRFPKYLHKIIEKGNRDRDLSEF